MVDICELKDVEPTHVHVENILNELHLSLVHVGFPYFSPQWIDVNMRSIWCLHRPNQINICFVC